jgi:hypothetical protein
MAWRTDRYGYARRTINNLPLSPKSVFAHREIMARITGRDLTSNDIVDHINRDRTDNRRENLRLTNKTGNSQNRVTGVFRGTCLHKSGKWQASVGVNRRLIYLGLFSDRMDAARAAADFRKKNSFLSDEKTGQIEPL